MSTVVSIPEQTQLGSPANFLSPTAAATSRVAPKTQRVLACVQCQQRKVKCNRKFPCANCNKAGVKCIPAALVPRQRRRRFPERDLLERLRHYEDLLRLNKIEFEPLHASTAEKLSPSEGFRGHDSADEAASEEIPEGLHRQAIDMTTIKTETIYEAKNLWHAMNQRAQSNEDDEDDDCDDDDDEHVVGNDVLRNELHGAMIWKALDQWFESNDHLLFGSRKMMVDLSTLHPGQGQIFRLWQIYLENVNPLLKVTHTPTLQTRIIDAANNVANVSPTMEALIFSIYCVAVTSLKNDECVALFGLSKKDLRTGYQFGCQQALANCDYLRSGDRDCLTALYLYLVSVRPDTDPRSLSSILGVALRIAQRMGIHNESANAKCPIFEAEMRRRLWWSLMLYDTRICEMCDYKPVMLTPAWDCKVPLNVDDYDLRPEMKTQPVAHSKPTEAIFTVVRSEMGDFIRYCAFHLDFTNPALKAIARDTKQVSLPGDKELVTLEKTMQDNYLQTCNPENPLHFMTLWTVRGLLAKNRLVEHYSRSLGPSVQQTDSQRHVGLCHALTLLECDTTLLTSPLTKGYLWLVEFQFPFPAYIHVVQHLKRQPTGEHAAKAWEVLNDNYIARFADMEQDNTLFFKLFSKNILQSWEARQAMFGHLDQPLESPKIVLDVQRRTRPITSTIHDDDMGHGNDSVGIDIGDFSMPMAMDFSDEGLIYSMGEQDLATSGAEDHGNVAAHDSTALNLNHLDWSTLDWNPINPQGW